MRILAIDPGYELLGLAILEKEDAGQPSLVFSDRLTTSRDLPHSRRLGDITNGIEEVLSRYQPETVAIEALFFNTNQKTAIKVAEARGAVLAMAARANRKVYEFTPPQIKIAVTGHGRSDKKQVIAMVPRLVTVSKAITHDDEWDAIAIGLTFFAHQASLDLKTQHKTEG